MTCGAFDLGSGGAPFLSAGAASRCHYDLLASTCERRNGHSGASRCASPYRMQIDFDLDVYGLLVLLDLTYPGLRSSARVDGNERAIHTVAGLFRGVEVRGGERKLEFTY